MQDSPRSTKETSLHGGGSRWTPIYDTPRLWSPLLHVKVVTKSSPKMGDDKHTSLAASNILRHDWRPRMHLMAQSTCGNPKVSRTSISLLEQQARSLMDTSNTSPLLGEAVNANTTVATRAPMPKKGATIGSKPNPTLMWLCNLGYVIGDL